MNEFSIIKKYFSDLSKKNKGTFGLSDDIFFDYKKKIAISLDVRNGFIALSGWKKQTNIPAIDFVKKIENFGVSRIIYTDINKDGTKKGPNIKDTVELSSKVKIPFVISGGISSIEDIKKIKSLNNSNIEGVIVGKSIYDGDIKIKELAKQM